MYGSDFTSNTQDRAVSVSKARLKIEYRIQRRPAKKGYRFCALRRQLKVRGASRRYRSWDEAMPMTQTICRHMRRAMPRPCGVARPWPAGWPRPDDLLAMLAQPSSVATGHRLTSGDEAAGSDAALTVRGVQNQRQPDCRKSFTCRSACWRPSPACRS